MLLAFAAGLGCGVLAFVIGSMWRAPKAEEALVLTYMKPTGLRRYPAAFYANDPAKSFGSTSEYLVAVASKCKVRAWRMDASTFDCDADDVTKLIVDRDQIDSKAFDCLASHVAPPNIKLSLLSR